MSADRQFDLLLETKLQQPPLRSEVVLRERLVDKLNSGLNRRLTLISAPAGYGKTSLVLSWLKNVHQPVVWVSLDEQDNNPIRFFSYLAAAIFTTQLLSDKMVGSDLPSLEHLSVDDLVLLIHHRLVETPFTLIILDDYHSITDLEIHRRLAYLIQNLPVSGDDKLLPDRGCHFVLTTRTDPALPLSRWRLGDEITEIRMADLRFLVDEAKLAFAQNRKMSLSDQNLQILLEKTEGWAASMQLASILLKDLSVQDQTDLIHQLSGNNAYIADYLAEEVFKKIDPDMRSFLVQTSALERVSADLARAITGRADCQNRLELLEHSNTFVIPLDASRGWYRYHPLFRDFLLSKLQDDQNIDKRDLLIHAAAWYYENEFIEDSLKCLISAREFDRAASVVIESSPRILSRGQFYILRNILDAFPVEIIQTWPELSIYRAWANYMMNPESVEIWLNLADQVIQNKLKNQEITEDYANGLIGEIAALRAFCAIRQGDIATFTYHAPRALELLPVDSLRIRGLVLNVNAFSHYCDFNLENAINMYFTARDVLIRGGNLAGAASESVRMAGDIRTMQGQIHAAAALYRMATDLEDTAGTSRMSFACCARSGLGRLAYEWNRMDEAQALLQKGSEDSKRMGIAEQITCDLAQAEILMELGQLDRAWELIHHHYDGVSRRQPLFALDRLLKADWMRLQVLCGSRDAVGKLQTASTAGLYSNPIEEMEALIVARCFFGLKDYKASLNITQKLIPAMESGARFGLLIKALVLSAISMWSLRRSGEAIDYAVKALNLSADEGYIRTYLDYGIPMQDMLVWIDKSEHSGCQIKDQAYLNRLIGLFENAEPLSASVSRVPSSSVDSVGAISFTDQETKVLRYLIAGQNNREVASELSVSINTVKTHVRNIYEKLGVHNRFQANIRLQELKIKL